MQKKSSNYKRLELVDLEGIYVMRISGKTIQEIAKILFRSASTICEALNKYQHPSWRVWMAMDAFERARHVFRRMKENRSRQGNHGHLKDEQARKYVVDRLVDEQWSPEKIAGRMAIERPEIAVTTKTIYNFTKYERKDLQRYLYERGKPRRQRVANRRGRFRQGAPKKRSIEERPLEANNRTEVGHWEADTIVSRRGGSKAVLSLRERKLRKRFFYLLPNLQAESTLGVLRAFLETVPAEYRKSITFDNGSEFGISEMIKLETWYRGLKLYFCDSYSAWQKGSVENSNRDFRWYFPKGTDFADVSSTEIRVVEHKLNSRPMKCLNFSSSDEVFYLKLAA